MGVTKILVSALIAFLFLGCDKAAPTSAGNSSDQVLEEKPVFPAAGSINGKLWAYRSGKAYRLGPFLIVTLWNAVTSNPCEHVPKTPLQVRLKTWPQLGSLNIGQDAFRAVPVVFFIDEDLSADPGNPFFSSVDVHANVGSIRIDEILEGPTTLVSGRFEGAFNNDKVPLTAVSGSFQVPLCDENHL